MSRLPMVLSVCLLCGCQWPPGPDRQQSATVQLVRADGGYEVAALAKDEVVVKVVQSRIHSLDDFPNVAEGLSFNLKAMTRMADQACSTGAKPDFLLYNEFPLTGYHSGSRDEKLKYTITIPGPETASLGEVAKACDAYIIFGSYARDDDWPGHILSINAVIGRDGELKKRFWKTRNVSRLSEDGEIPTTTIENVYDRYVARYGVEELYPVLRTEYGNIAVSTVQIDPFVFAAFAMRGVEIMFRTATLFSVADVKAVASFNRFYSAMSNFVLPEDSDYARWGGNSLIVDPRGDVMAELPGNVEGIIAAAIPIAEFRRNRTLPRFPLEVTAPVFRQYVQEVPLNHLDLPAGELPQTRAEMKALLDQRSRWLNPDGPG